MGGTRWLYQPFLKVEEHSEPPCYNGPMSLTGLDHETPQDFGEPEGDGPGVACEQHPAPKEYDPAFHIRMAMNWKLFPHGAYPKLRLPSSETKEENPD